MQAIWAGLWTTCRHVCITFKYATESIFRARYLQKTGFHFDLGKNAHLLPCFMLTVRPGKLLAGSDCEPMIEDFILTADFEFSKLPEDGSTAIFQVERGAPEELMAPTRKRMQAYVGNMDIEPQSTRFGYVETFSMGQFLIFHSIERDVN
jgi:hypothetical protein